MQLSAMKVIRMFDIAETGSYTLSRNSLDQNSNLAPMADLLSLSPFLIKKHTLECERMVCRS
jgi:hypothetical protein